jgi:hypothetical protein
MKVKTIIILSALMISSFIMHAQDQQKLLYQAKVEKYTKMKHAGVGLTIGGAVLTGIGIGLMVDGIRKVNNDLYDPYDPNSSDSADGSGEALIGYLGFVLGVSTTTTGIILWSVGSSKSNKYQQRLNSISLNLNPARHQMISLAYRF